MKAFETIAWSAVGDGSNTGPFVPVVGDSARIRDAKSAFLAAAAGRNSASGSVVWSLRSSLMHDAKEALQLGFPEKDKTSIYPALPGQKLVPQDDLTVGGSDNASGTLVDLFSLTVGYEGLAGIDGNFVDRKALERRVEDLYSVAVTSPSLTGGFYGTQVAINSDQDQFKANREYALLGVSVTGDNGAAFSIGFTGVDWGNLRVAVPLSGFDPDLDARYFVNMSDRIGEAAVPVFNASNKDTTMMDILPAINSVPVVVVVHLALLKSSSRR